jgi:hypothetical protein
MEFFHPTLRLHLLILLSSACFAQHGSIASNAWIYRYISAGYDGRPDDPYTRLENGNTYNLTGYYPQAGRNFLLGLTVKF